MTESTAHLSKQRLRTPRTAAVAGIIFAVLLGTSHVLIQLSVPADLLDTSDWLQDQTQAISLALMLVPFAGISFLWFMAVVRDRIGHLEDQFFSTLFFGSGFLYLGMTLAAAAIASGTLTLYASDPDLLIGSEGYALFRIVVNELNVYAIRMAGMFMFVLGTIWVRAQVMPRWLALASYVLAAILLLSFGFFPLVVMIFPAWVLVISVYILILDGRARDKEVEKTADS
ncbi:MAG TPA: hypothetical protein ENK32_02080 [Anaerolineae bacterium]|nr:hypothetical protein [Anaerolineae bacterium]